MYNNRNIGNETAKKVFIVCLIICSCFVFGSCSPKQSSTELTAARLIQNFDINDIENAEIADNTITITSKYSGDYHLNYVIKGGSPEEMCVVSVEYSLSKNAKPNVSVNTDVSFDCNGNYTQSVILQKNDHSVIKHLIQLNENGESSFTVHIGDQQNKLLGTVKMKEPKISEVKDDEEIVMISDQDDTIHFYFFKDDLRQLDPSAEVAADLAQRLSVLKSLMQDFCHQKENIGLHYVFTENVIATGMAGYPVYINNRDLEILFRSNPRNSSEPLSKEDFLCILCHEMSHVFDMCDKNGNTYDYCFDKEFFAILKEMYALDSAHYNLNYDFLGKEEYLSKGIYNYQEFLKYYLKSLNVLKEPQNWKGLQKILYENNDAFKNLSKNEACNQLIELTVKEYHKNILQSFDKKALDTIKKKYRIP